MGRGRGRLGSSANRSRSPCLRCKVGVQGLGAGSSALGCFFLLVEGVFGFVLLEGMKSLHRTPGLSGYPRTGLFSVLRHIERLECKDCQVRTSVPSALGAEVVLRRGEVAKLP